MRKRSHEMADCAWRESDFTIQIFPRYKLREIPRCHFQRRLHLFKKRPKLSPKAVGLFPVLELAKTGILPHQSAKSGIPRSELRYA